jgi:hypothetical protein
MTIYLKDIWPISSPRKARRVKGANRAEGAAGRHRRAVGRADRAED